MKISQESRLQLEQTVEAYLESDGENTDNVSELVSDALNGVCHFEVFDALGCDDLGLIEKNLELQKIYKKILKEWSKSSQSIKH